MFKTNEKYLFKEARRTMMGPPPSMTGFTSVTQVSLVMDSYKPVMTKQIFGKFNFHLIGGEVSIHSDNNLKKSPDDVYSEYLTKLYLIDTVFEQAIIHINRKAPDRFYFRSFLNKETEGNEYGASLLLIIPSLEDSKGMEYGTLELSSCYKKVRMTPTRKELKKLLIKSRKALDIHISDFIEAMTHFE